MSSATAPTAGDADGSHLRLTLSNRREALDETRQRVIDFLEPHAPSPQSRFNVELMLEETLMNIIWHAFADAAEHLIEVSVRVEADDVALRFQDDGTPFDPLLATPPVLPTSIDMAAPGGLGLMLVRRCATSIDYRREGGSNVLTVRVARH